MLILSRYAILYIVLICFYWVIHLAPPVKRLHAIFSHNEKRRVFTVPKRGVYYFHAFFIAMFIALFV